MGKPLEFGSTVESSKKHLGKPEEIPLGVSIGISDRIPGGTSERVIREISIKIIRQTSEGNASEFSRRIPLGIREGLVEGIPG